MPVTAAIRRVCALLVDLRLRGNHPCNGLRPVQ